MAISRSPIPFLERKGLIPTRRYPVPRLDLVRVAADNLPLDNPPQNPGAMLDAQGFPSPDRGKLDPWPPPAEVRDNEPQ